MFFVIDGYNLALGAQLAKSLAGPGNPERARSRLIAWLSSRLDDIERSRTTVVFDSKDSPSTARELRIAEMRILFAVDYPDADSMLEALIAQHSSPKQLAVISSDQRVLAAAKARRALGITSQDWFERLEKRLRMPPPLPESTEKPELNHPEQLVSEFDTAEIRRMIEDEIQPLRRTDRRRRPRS
jgi:predicted RNA-binding protein with PIN domain